jgi:FixJ family two-component response regulator
MGAGGGLKAPEEIAKAAPGTKVLILSMHSDPAFVRTAMLAGAAGYVSKKTAHTELLKALRTIRAGKRYVDSAVSEGLLPETARKGAVLSQREEQVLLLIASGHSYQEIADRISVSVKTVETYRARIMENWNSKAAQSSCSTPLTQVCWDAISREPSPRACWNENFIFVQDHQAGTCVDGVSLATLRGKVGKTPDKQPLLFGTSLTI